MCFVIDIIFVFKAIKSNIKGSYNKQNITLVVMSYEIYETRLRLVSYISYEMTTSVRSSIFKPTDIIVNDVNCDSFAFF